MAVNFETLFNRVTGKAKLLDKIKRLERKLPKKDEVVIPKNVHEQLNRVFKEFNKPSNIFFTAEQYNQTLKDEADMQRELFGAIDNLQKERDEMMNLMFEWYVG